jgi:HTH-type transcriptional regulator/antitoxin HigA
MKAIRTKEDHEQALHIASKLFENPPPVDSPAGERFRVLLALIEAYERKEYPMDVSHPIETITLRTKQTD